MSVIVGYLKCNNCEQEYKDIYVSLGHPEKDFIWKWKCTECESVNEMHIKAFPHPACGPFIPIKDIQRGD